MLDADGGHGDQLRAARLASPALVGVGELSVGDRRGCRRTGRRIRCSRLGLGIALLAARSARRIAPRWPDAPTSNPARHGFAALVRSSIPPMHPAGLPFVGASLAVAALGHRNRWLRNAGLAAAAANAAFFRHPPRVPPTRPGLVVAPADGLICLIQEAVPPAELGLPATPLLRVSIFLSILDTHVQRAPISGEVVAASHRPGKFHSAELEAASEHNERNSVVIRTPEGVEVIAVQIAGLVARRIICDVEGGRQADDRRHVWPDPVRLTAGHLPACRLEPPGHGRSARARRRNGIGRAALPPGIGSDPASRRRWSACASCPAP